MPIKRKYKKVISLRIHTPTTIPHLPVTIKMMSLPAYVTLFISVECSVVQLFIELARSI